MNYRSIRLALAAGLGLPLALAGASFAQAAAAPPPGAAAGDHQPMQRHWDPAQMRAHMAEHLRTVLQLQPSQDGALNAFLDAMKPAGGMRDRPGADDGGDRGRMQHMTTPERLDRMAQRMDEQHVRMMARIAATKQFYAQLSPSQQKAFDDIGPMMMGHRGGHGMDGGKGGPGDGHGWGGGRDDGMGPGAPPRG
jgi:hypothetical protein